MIYLLCFLIGVVAGLRAMTAPAAVSWAAALGWIDLSGTWAAFMGATVTPWIFTIVALVELVTDKLPRTPSRLVPMQFGARVVSGAFCGAVLGLTADAWILGLVAGALGAVAGTYLGAMLRRRLVAAIGGRDTPIALLEDATAIVLAALIVSGLT